MAVVLSGAKMALRMDDVELNAPWLGQVTSRSLALIKVEYDLPLPGNRNEFGGTFLAGVAGQSSLGALTDVREYRGGEVLFAVTGFSLPASAVDVWLTPGNGGVAWAQLLSGDDEVVGSPFSDFLFAHGGRDSLTGDDGDDLLWGLDGDDKLRGDDGRDTLVGGAGFDDMHGGKGDDSVGGGAGADWVVGGQGVDILIGGTEGDLVYGNIGDDVCWGEAGDDTIRGGQDTDFMVGGDGNDWLSGDRGADTIWGGAGADTFNVFTGCGLDRIEDFKFAEGDRIRLEGGGAYTVAQAGADTVISLAGGDTVVLVGVTAATLPPGFIYIA
ncbi:MAG TPA: calcium-binding protein [Phenylobacterium sp.]